MKKAMTIYHGSSQIIQIPERGKGNPYNDYGIGFYCTESLELAKEWACSEKQDGYANEYTFNLAGLSTLYLSDNKYNILNWLSILLMNRRFVISSEIAVQAKEYLTDNFLPNYEAFDVIVGYRADDSYFSFATAFLNNTISLAQLEHAMRLGKLGEQIVLKSEKAFSHLRFNRSFPSERSIYYPKKVARDNEARSAFRDEKGTAPIKDAVYMMDILRGEWRNDDPRLQ